MLFNNFCLWMSICALLVKIQPGKVVWWCADGDFLAILCIVSSASRMQHISHVHPKFALRPHPVWKYGRHAIFDGWEQAKKHRKKKPQAKNIMLCRIPDGDHKTKENADVYVMSNICIDHTCAQQERLNFWLLLKPTCVIPAPRCNPRSVTSRSCSSQFLHTCSPLQCRSPDFSPALLRFRSSVSSSTVKKWTDSSLNVMYRPICIYYPWVTFTILQISWHKHYIIGNWNLFESFAFSYKFWI